MSLLSVANICFREITHIHLLHKIVYIITYKNLQKIQGKKKKEYLTSANTLGFPI